MKLALKLLKKYWFLGLLAIIAVYHYVRMDNMGELLDIANKSYETQIVELRKLHTEELKGRDNILKEHEEKIEKIDERYKMAKWALRKERAKTIKQIQKESPDQIVKRIVEAYGLRYVKKSPSNNR